jgi:hypothetical protein
MDRFFTRERFGRPQVLAALFLLALLIQGIWLLKRGGTDRTIDPAQIYRVERGLALWRGAGADSVSEFPAASSGEEANPEEKLQRPFADGVFDRDHSPLWYLIAATPLLWPALRPQTASDLRLLAAAPYLAFGLLLGASLWYVSRRLFGNAGGYIALGLYCFSPGIIRASGVWFAEPEIGAAWGVFGAIFTAIAVAHTLYAPREVILWNWRRIILLGLSLALAVGSQFSMAIVLPATLGFMLYLAPTRRAAAAAIWVVACAIAALLLFASYFFQRRAFWLGMKHASFFGVTWKAFALPQAYHQVLAQLGQSSPALVVALPVALVSYFIWPRARYFGNAAPLLVAVLSLVLALGTPHYPGVAFQLIAVAFLFVFVAGIAADLLETRHRPLAMAGIWGLLLANAVWNLWELARVGGV